MVDVEATLRSSLDGRYDIEGEVGRGGMSVVYRARDLKHNRTVAIKVLKPELSAAVSADRFHREIEVVAGLTHPHILPLYDSGEADGLLFYVMPYVDGESLREHLERDGRLTVQRAIRIAREIADALGFAHRGGIVHRDVKPGNILLTEDHALLADFGIAHLAETEGATLTVTSQTLGTPAYFSPEQATGEREVDGRSDIYSLGCVLFEMLTGRPPFIETSFWALITHHIVDPPPLVQELRPGPDISDSLEAVVQTSLQKDPENRFQSAGEFAGSLSVVSGGAGPAAAAALKKLVGPRHKWLQGKRLAVLAIVAVLALVAVGLLVRANLRHPGFTSMRPTYVVLPWGGEELTEEEAALAARAARELSWHLSDWESIDVVEAPSLEGPSVMVVRAGFGSPTNSLDAGIELMESVPATHLIFVNVNTRGDSLELAAIIYRSGDRRRHERSFRAEGRNSELDLITADLALQILGLHGEPAKLEDLNQRSRNHLAHQQFNDGRAALWDWRLAEAEEHFRLAIERDSAFALAHYFLATTMYWRTVRDPLRLLDEGGIERHVLRAHRFGDSTRLRPGERRDVDAFRAFWAGDYETARTLYNSILERRPTDLDALVLAGSVEYEDPWLTEASGSDGGNLYPRQDLDRARVVFDSAVGLSSHVQLAWGRLFDIDRYLAESVYEGWCSAFQPPGGPLVPPYRTREAAEQRRFCSFIDDGSIRWKPDTLTRSERERAIEAVSARRAQVKDRLDWWESVQRDQARPHEEMADWLLWERNVKGCATEPAEADSLLREARIHMSRALTIRGDTTPENRVRLASLMLAAGDTAEAISHVDRALNDLGAWQSGDGTAPPGFAANVYLAQSRSHPTAEILTVSMRDDTWAITDNAGGVKIPAGEGVRAMVWALHALGLTEDDRPWIESRFELLDGIWREPEYDDRQQVLLRAAATDHVSAALVHVPERWDGWFSDWEVHGKQIPSVWKGLLSVQSDPVGAGRHLLEAINELNARPLNRTWAIDYHMPIILARRLGESSVAEELSARAARCPLMINELDFGWGMKRTSTGDARD